MGLKPSRANASPQWGLPPDQLCKQIKDGVEADKEAIEQVTETLPRIEKVKQELASDGMADCITLLEQHSPLDRLMERDHGLPEEHRSAHLPGSYREALELAVAWLIWASMGPMCLSGRFWPISQATDTHP